jgi:hypothetical protein
MSILRAENKKRLSPFSRFFAKIDIFPFVIAH